MFTPAFDKEVEVLSKNETDYMLSATKIEQRASEWVNQNPIVKDEIQILKNDKIELFNYFMRYVKRNDYLIVSYILNKCFSTAKERADFGNSRDESGNSAYHYAAQFGFSEIVIILNDKRKFLGGTKFFLFTLTNNQNETPLDVCCKAGPVETFNLIWRRAGKPNHNPLHCLEYACVKGNVEIINEILNHPRIKLNFSDISITVQKGLEGKFGNSVKGCFLELEINKKMENVANTKSFKRNFC